MYPKYLIKQHKLIIKYQSEVPYKSIDTLPPSQLPKDNVNSNYQLLSLSPLTSPTSEILQILKYNEKFAGFFRFRQLLLLYGCSAMTSFLGFIAWSDASTSYFFWGEFNVSGWKSVQAKVLEDFSLTDWLFEMCHRSIYIVAMASF